MTFAAALRFTRHTLPLLAACWALVGCHYSDSEGMPVALYESADGEAVLRQLIKELPDARWEVLRTVAEGDLVFLHARFTPAAEWSPPT